jgi:hypothetical protein
MEVSTKISKAGLEVRQCVARSGSLQETPERVVHEVIREKAKLK